MKYIVVLVFTLAMKSLFAQTSDVKVAHSNFESLKEQFNYHTDFTIESKRRVQTFFQTSTTSLNDAPSMANIPSAYNYDHLAIFCKLEVQIEKATNIPIKFRLGEFNQIEKLEGKPYSPFLMNGSQ